MEIYVVKSGDTLYSIARRFNLPMDEIVYDKDLHGAKQWDINGEQTAIGVEKIS